MDPRREKLDKLARQAAVLRDAPACRRCRSFTEMGCSHPLVGTLDVNFLDGGFELLGHADTRVMRAPEGLCGPLGDLYDPLSPQERARRWLVGGATSAWNKINRPLNSWDWFFIIMLLAMIVSRRGIILTPVLITCWILFRLFFRGEDE